MLCESVMETTRFCYKEHFYKQHFYKQHQAEFWEILSKHLRLKFSSEEKNTENTKRLYFVKTEIE